MALALYRTYRPGTLSEVIGQEHVTEPLARALSAGRLHHAYLFSGPRGCGKTSTARILARSMNCVEGPTPTPCGACRSCQELAPNGPGSIDVVELDAATHRGIDDARELREKAIYAPAASRFKVYIIDEAHQLTNEAANALLKLVEEPPPHLRFIFATTEPDRIIPTIRSRTFHYGFRLVPARILAEHLAGVCRAEDVAAEPPALGVVARAGAGSVRDSLSVLGQLLAGAGPGGLTYADAVASLGMTDAGLIDAFMEALATGSAAQMFVVVESVISAGHDPRRFVSDVLDRLRDLLVLRADPQALSHGLIDVPDDASERMLTQAQSLGLAELSRAADLVSAGLSEMKGATAPRLQLELLCARLALPPLGDDLASVVARIERLERLERLERGATTAGTPVAGDAGVEGDGVGPAASPGPPAHGSGPAPVGPAGAGAGAVPAPPRRPQLRSGTGHVAGGHAAAGPELSAPAPDVLAPAPVLPAPAVEPAAEPVPSPVQELEVASPVGGHQPTPQQPTPQQPTPEKHAAESSAADLGRIQSAWATILQQLAGSSRVAWTAFHSATAVSLSEGALAVALPEPGNVRAIAQRGHDERLRQAIIDVVGMDVSIDVIHHPDAAPPAPGRPAGPGGPPDSSRASASAARVPAGARTPPPRASGRTDPSAAGGQRSAAVEPSASGRPVDPVRAGRDLAPASEAPDDAASPDDPDLDAAVDGLALITRELGARPIGEIDHS